MDISFTFVCCVCRQGTLYSWKGPWAILSPWIVLHTGPKVSDQGQPAVWASLPKMDGISARRQSRVLHQLCSYLPLAAIWQDVCRASTQHIHAAANVSLVPSSSSCILKVKLLFCRLPHWSVSSCSYLEQKSGTIWGSSDGPEKLFLLFLFHSFFSSLFALFFPPSFFCFLFHSLVHTPVLTKNQAIWGSSHEQTKIIFFSSLFVLFFLPIFLLFFVSRLSSFSLEVIGLQKNCPLSSCLAGMPDWMSSLSDEKESMSDPCASWQHA